MKKIILSLTIVAMAGSTWVAGAANVPSGLTGLWRFEGSADKYHATIGTDLTSTFNNGWLTGPWTQMGTDTQPALYSDNGVLQEVSNGYLTVTHGMAPNGGSYVNQYTVAIDYVQTSDGPFWNGEQYNSLYQTATGNGNDGDLFIKGATRAASVIGNGDTGYSSLTFDASQWHRIVWSVDNSSFFRVYVDGTLFLNGAGQGADGRFSLDPTFLLFADNDWEDAWGMVGTVATWDRALTTQEVAGMGGWIGGSDVPTPLTLQVVPEPGMLSLLALGGLALFLRKRQ